VVKLLQLHVSPMAIANRQTTAGRLDVDDDIMMFGSTSTSTIAVASYF
jgi:hypothetical protein